MAQSSTPESKVKAGIKRLLDKLGIWYYMPVAGPFAVHGIPDFICCWDGQFLAIEAKAPGKLKTLTYHQQAKIDEINAANGFAVAVDSVEVLRELLTKLNDERLLRVADRSSQASNEHAEAFFGGEPF